jgi:Na+/H+ antiporter NhaA
MKKNIVILSHQFLTHSFLKRCCWSMLNLCYNIKLEIITVIINIIIALNDFFLADFFKFVTSTTKKEFFYKSFSLLKKTNSPICQVCHV